MHIVRLGVFFRLRNLELSLRFYLESSSIQDIIIPTCLESLKLWSNLVLDLGLQIWETISFLSNNSLFFGWLSIWCILCWGGLVLMTRKDSV